MPNQNKTLLDRMLDVMGDVNAQVAEREELVEAIAIALLTRKNLFILGAPGQAKSYAINQFRARITGARQFERLLSKQTDEEQLFGRIDLSSLLPGNVPESVASGDELYQHLRSKLECFVESFSSQKDSPSTYELLRAHTAALADYRAALAALHTGQPQVNTSGKLPEADIVMLDEIFKCNDGVLALNERKYTNEGRTYPIPAVSFFAASNEIPNFNDPQEKILEALYDRLELKVVTDNIADRTKRLAVLADKQAGRAGQIAASITLDELTEMQRQVAAIPVPDAVNELADDILCQLVHGITVSDRKYLNYYPIAQAKAWLSGHDRVEPQDLLALKNYLWQKPGDRPAVEAALERMCVNPMQDKVNNLRAMALDVQTEFDANRADAGMPNAGSKALIKLRGELVRLYGEQRRTKTMLNHIVVMGRLTRDPELRHTQAGTAVASFTVAVDRDYKNKETDKRETDFIDCVAWRSTGEFVSKYFAKGRMAVVEGRLQLRAWQDKERNRRVSTEILVSNVYFGDSKPKDDGSAGGKAKAGKDDDFQLPEGFGTSGDGFADLADDDGDLPF